MVDRAYKLSTNLFCDFGDSVTDGGDTAGLLIGNLDTEHTLEFHEKFYGVQRVGTEVVSEASGLSYSAFFYTELVNDNILDLLYDFFLCHNVRF